MIHSELPRLQIVVLAAGLSSRLGRSKAFAKIHGESLILRTVKVLAPFATNRIIVVIGPRAQRMRVELRGRAIVFVVNPVRVLGLATSVIRGVRASRYSGATLLVPMDLPELDARDLKRLISRWRGARRRVVARRVGERASVPVILPRALYWRVREIAGDVGLRNLLAELPANGRTLIHLPSAERDVDTPRELGDARRRARSLYLTRYNPTS
jgi:molybdenum cofactor cytidylyltransferase